MTTLDIEFDNRFTIDGDPFPLFLRELLEATTEQATTELPAFVSERSAGHEHITHEAEGCWYLYVLFSHEGVVLLEDCALSLYIRCVCVGDESAFLVCVLLGTHADGFCLLVIADVREGPPTFVFKKCDQAGVGYDLW